MLPDDVLEFSSEAMDAVDNDERTDCVDCVESDDNEAEDATMVEKIESAYVVSGQIVSFWRCKQLAWGTYGWRRK